MIKRDIKSYVLAKFTPRNSDSWGNRTIELCAKRKLFVFKFAYSIGKNEVFYETVDPNWPGTEVISILDLELLKI
jgi:hypothetical protein